MGGSCWLSTLTRKAVSPAQRRGTIGLRIMNSAAIPKPGGRVPAVAASISISAIPRIFPSAIRRKRSPESTFVPRAGLSLRHHPGIRTASNISGPSCPLTPTWLKRRNGCWTRSGPRKLCHWQRKQLHRLRRGCRAISAFLNAYSGHHQPVSDINAGHRFMGAHRRWP